MNVKHNYIQVILCSLTLTISSFLYAEEKTTENGASVSQEIAGLDIPLDEFIEKMTNYFCEVAYNNFMIRDYKTALFYYSQALNLDPNFERAKKAIEEIEKMQKESS